MTPDFSADITLINDPDEGLRIEVQERFVPRLSRALVAAGLTVTGSRVSVPGTAKLSALVEVSVEGTFEGMKAAIHAELTAAGVRVSEENFSALGEKKIRFNLDNVSMFNP